MSAKGSSQLSIIVPISQMSGRLQNLRSWISKSSALEVQIIFVHDRKDQATQDELLEIISGEANQDIHIVQGNFEGPGGARNAGLKIATGDWITFWDSDDVPEMANVLRATTLAPKGTEVILGRYDVCEIETHKVLRAPLTEHSLVTIALNPGLWRMVFSRTLISGITFPQLKMGEDQIFIARCGLPRRMIFWSDSIFYHYYIGDPRQLTNQRSSMADLIPASKETLVYLKRSRGEIQTFYAIMYVRQVITLLKHGSILLRLEMITKFFLQFLIASQKTRSAIIFGVKTILFKTDLRNSNS
jgi:glycosyltransferase involved in cell wall biosynthesis